MDGFYESARSRSMALAHGALKNFPPRVRRELIRSKQKQQKKKKVWH
jgi:hypothetical protein